MVFIPASGNNHAYFTRVVILAWGEAKQQSTSHHPHRAMLSSYKCCGLLRMDQGPLRWKRFHCFENHYRTLAWSSSPARNGLIQKGLLKCTIPAPSSWVLVLHSSRWYWMAEQGRDTEGGGRARAPRHLPHRPYTASWEQPKSQIRCSDNTWGALTLLFQRAHSSAHASVAAGWHAQ